MSAFLSEVARDVARESGSAWLPGSLALVVATLALVVLAAREVSRGVLAGEREQRARATVVVGALVVWPALW